MRATNPGRRRRSQASPIVRASTTRFRSTRTTTRKGRGRWRLFRQDRVAFENIAPIVSIGLNRSIFASRRVALKFNKGALEAMCLVKTSELEGAVAVPYEIAKSIVALPTQIFEIKIGNISDNIELLQAERKVVLAQQEYLDFLSDITQQAAAGGDKQVVPLEQGNNTLPRPTQINLGFGQATTDSLMQSDVLKQICSNAPSIIAPGNRDPKGRP